MSHRNLIVLKVSRPEILACQPLH